MTKGQMKAEMVKLREMNRRTSARRKVYDYERGVKMAARNEQACPQWRGTTVRKVLRKLVREAVIKAGETYNQEWEDGPEAIADRIAKDLVL